MNSPNEPMSVKMETKLVVKIAGHTHRLTMEKARELHAELSRFILSGDEDSLPFQELKRVREIRVCILNYFGLDAVVFASRARPQSYVWPRMIAMLLSREMTKRMSREEIGKEFGDRTHGAVSYAIQTVSNHVATDRHKRAEVEAIRAKLNGNGGAQ